MTASDNHESMTGKFVSLSVLVSGLGVTLMVVVGWLFTTGEYASNEIRGDQAIASVRSAINQTRLNDIDARLNKVVDQQIKGLVSTSINSTKILFIEQIIDDCVADKNKRGGDE